MLAPVATIAVSCCCTNFAERYEVARFEVSGGDGMQHDGQVTCCVQIAEGDRRNWRLTETAGSETHGDTVILTLYIEQVVLSLKHARRSMGQVRGNYAMARGPPPQARALRVHARRRSLHRRKGQLV